MSLSNFAVKKPVTITMMVLIIVLLGTISLNRLPIELFPEIDVPVAIVMTSYTGTGPQEMESLITKPIEGAVATVGNIDKVSSISSQGSSIVIAQFNSGTDMDFATLEMREKVDLVKGILPEDATEPMVLKIDPNAMPIMQLSISAEGDLAGLQTLVEDTISQRFERIEGVASVDIGGGFIEEVEIALDQNKLAAYGLNINQLAQIIGSNNLNLSGGNVDKGNQTLTSRVVGEFESIDEIRNMPISLNSGHVIRLGDISSVELVNKEIESISRTNGKDDITLSLRKQPGKNTVKVANLVNRELEKLEREYPNIEFNMIMDNSIMIKDSIDNIVKNVIMGSIFAIIVLYMFLKNIRTTLIIGVSIPISLIASFILLYFNGITLNMMTLGGLALAVGMLVDSAIVVLENIFRFRTEGHSRIDSAIKGAGEVSMAITASTLTTVAVFLPIVFVEGMIGIMFKDFALTVTLSLIASLLVSISLIPMLSSKILKVDLDNGEVKKRRLERMYNAFDRAFAKVEDFYGRLLNKSLKHKKLVIVVSIVVFVLGIFSLVGVGMEFFPTMDEGTLFINVNMPAGTSLDNRDILAEGIEEKLWTIPEIEKVFTNISMGGNQIGHMGSGGDSSIFVGLVKLRDRKRSTAQVVEEIRTMVRDIPGAEIVVKEYSSTGMSRTSDPINISIKGDELETLESISEDFKNIVESVEGTREVKTSLSDAIPEIEVLVNKEMAANYGLTTSQIANAVRGATSGITVTKYKDRAKELDVVIRAKGDFKDNLSSFSQIDVTTPRGVNIPLEQVAKISVEKGPIRINREDQERVVNVSSQISGRDLRSIAKDIEDKLKNYEMPQGYSYNIGGENEEMMEAFSQLFLALILAIILIYMVMAAQFESLIHPFIIMFTIPLAFSGGILSLFITRKTFGVTAFIGMIMLAGIVVNNGIVLIDYINVLRNEGKGKEEAIVIAGPIRLRPILMTTLTTVLGLVPLALGIGEGSELQAPMAVVVIGGLTLSTVLTLVFIPVLYTIFDDISASLKRKIKKAIG